MQDKRRNRRFLVKLPCRIRVEGQEGEPVAVTLVNVSLGGIGVVSREEVAAGSRVVFASGDLPFAGASDAALVCKVHNVHRSRLRPGEVRMGMVFDGTSPDLVQRLLQWAQAQVLIERRNQERMQRSRPPARSTFWG